MKSAPFAYHAPATVDEVVDLLARGDDVRVLAGGQSLVPLMKLRLLKPAALVDVNGVAGLDGVEERDGELWSARWCASRPCSTTVAARARPLLRDAGRHAGYRATRHRGTVGGSLAYAAAWAELTAAAVALDARIEVRSTRGERTVAAREFFHGPHETALAQDELITDVRSPPGRRGSRLPRGDAAAPRLPHVGAAAIVALDEAAPAARQGRAAARGRRALSADITALRGSALEETRSPSWTAKSRGSSAGRHRGLRPLPEARRELAHAACPPRRVRRREGGMTDLLRVRARGQRRPARRARRAARDARRLPARRARPQGHARRVRARVLAGTEPSAGRRDGAVGALPLRCAGGRVHADDGPRAGPPAACSARSRPHSTRTAGSSAASARPRCLHRPTRSSSALPWVCRYRRADRRAYRRCRLPVSGYQHIVDSIGAAP